MPEVKSLNTVTKKFSSKLAGSNPDGVIGIFHSHIPSRRTIAQESTQPLKEMSTRNISWRGKSGQCVGLTTLPPSYTGIALNFLLYL